MEQGEGCTPYIVCLLETKCGDNEADDIRASGRGVEWCSLNGSGVCYS